MKSSIVFPVILGLALLLCLGGLLLRGNEDVWICEKNPSTDLGEWVKRGNPSAPIPAEPCDTGTTDVAVTKQSAMLSVSGFKAYSFGETICAEGTVKNISAEKLGYVRSIFTFYEADGSVFDFSDGLINSSRGILMPGEEALFKRCTADKNAQIDTAKTKVHFEGKIGDIYKNTDLLFVIN